MSSLIHYKTIDGVEAYVVLEKPAITIGSRINGELLFLSSSSDKRINVKAIYKWGENSSENIFSKEIKLKKQMLTKVQIDVPVRDLVGRHGITLFIDEKPIDEAYFIVLDNSIKPTLFTIVWHHHQAPNYTPEGKIHAPWAYVYVWGAYLSPYGYGPYHYHSQLLIKKPEFKSTYNLSPSLLRQWISVIEKGIEFVDGKRVDPSSPEALLVKETLENYRKALFRGQIDVLSSIYAHTIAGFLVDVIDAADIVDEEISYGKEVTREVIGGNYDAEGFWTPEMAFSMGLIPLYSTNNIKYTVLDDQFHFHGAEGDKGTAYEPYMVINSGTGDYITVFFRDHELSDILGFLNNFYSEPHAWRNAYETAYRIVDKAIKINAKTLVLALDGENWMIFSKNPPLTAYYLDKLSDYLIELHRSRIIELSTLKEILSRNPPKRVLKHIPTNTWLGTFRKWRGEKREHEDYWVKIVERYRLLKTYERIIGGRDEQSREARWALWHALDSDYWWAEFWNPRVIDMWLSRFDEIIPARLSRVKIMDINVIDKPIEGNTISIKVVIKNDLDRDVKVSLRIKGIDLEVIEGGEVKPVKIKSHSISERIVKARILTWGKILLVATIIADGYVIDYKTKEINVIPLIRSNPV